MNLLKKVDIGKAQATSVSAFVLAGQHILAVLGDKTIPQIIASIPNMTLMEQTNTFLPIAIALFLFLFNEDRSKDDYIKLKRAYVKLKKRLVDE